MELIIKDGCSAGVSMTTDEKLALELLLEGVRSGLNCYEIKDCDNCEFVKSIYSPCTKYLCVLLDVIDSLSALQTKVV